MKTLNTQIEQWIHSAQKKIDNDSICQADLDYLSSILLSQHIRQRILYIHAVPPSIRSQLIAMSLHEPIKDQIAEIDPDYGEWPYRSVHDAVLDGWQIMQFPDQRANFDDREIDILGYEFILQKLEAYHE